METTYLPKLHSLTTEVLGQANGRFRIKSAQVDPGDSPLVS